MIALALAKCEIMPARQPREIACRNQSPPCDIFEMTRKLRPEGGFERDLLAHRDDAEIGEPCLPLGHASFGHGWRRPAHAETHIITATTRAARHTPPNALTAP